MLTARKTGIRRLPAGLFWGEDCIWRGTEGQALELIAQLHAALDEPEPWPDEVVETVPVPDAVRGRATT